MKNLLVLASITFQLFSGSVVFASEQNAENKTKAVVTCNVDKESAPSGFTGEWKITLDLAKKTAVVKSDVMDDYVNGNTMKIRYVVSGEDNKKPSFSAKMSDSSVMLVSIYGSNGDDIEFAINLTFNTFQFGKAKYEELAKSRNSVPAQMSFTVLDGQFQQATSRVINCTAEALP